MVSHFRRRKTACCKSAQYTGIFGAPCRYVIPRFPLAAAFLAYEAFFLDWGAPTLCHFRHGPPSASDHKTRQRAKRRGMLSHPAPGAVSNDARCLEGKKRGAEQFEAIEEQAVRRWRAPERHGTPHRSSQKEVQKPYGFWRPFGSFSGGGKGTPPAVGIPCKAPPLQGAKTPLPVRKRRSPAWTLHISTNRAAPAWST